MRQAVSGVLRKAREDMSRHHRHKGIFRRQQGSGRKETLPDSRPSRAYPRFPPVVGVVVIAIATTACNLTEQVRNAGAVAVGRAHEYLPQEGDGMGCSLVHGALVPNVAEQLPQGSVTRRLV